MEWINSLPRTLRRGILPLIYLPMMLRGLALAACLAGCLPGRAAAQDGITERARRYLNELIRLDTTNPPGNETKGAQYLKAILDREGIASEIFEMEPGRGNIVARIRGNGKKRPLLLMGAHRRRRRRT